MLKHVPFTIANGAAVSGIIDLGDYDAHIVGVSIHGTWTAAKVGFQAYVYGTATKEEVLFSPAVLGGTGAWTGGPYDTSAAFDQVKDTTGAAVQWGNGTDASAQYLVPAQQSVLGGFRYCKVTSGTGATNQAQAVNGYVLVETNG